jgi:hypothetical protein
MAIEGRTYLVPYLRHFPIWRLMMVNDTDYEWRPDWFGAWEYRA